MATTSTKRSSTTRPTTSNAGLDEKARRLDARLGSLDSLLVAYSGGADSAFLAWAATRALGPRALCVTAESPSYPEHHRQLALRVAQAAGLRHEFVRTDEMARPEYRANPVNRCYYCKDELFATLTAVARERGMAVIADGNNADDRGDYRPGRQAAREFGVISPLDEADLTKAEIRELSRAAGLPTWDEPASACLSSRIPYHSEVTPAKLQMIETAETALRALGFAVVRVRHEETGARVEIGRPELDRALEPGMAGRIANAVRHAGYAAVTIDPKGYRTGSLNEGVVLRPV
jgi:uncharacterized protein